MDEQRVRGYMGLSVRAGMAVFGEDGCMKSVRRGKCAALLLDAGASENTLSRYRKTCEHAGVPYFILPEGLLWRATGRPGMAMALKPGGLAEQLIGLLSGQDREKQDKVGGAVV